MGCNTPANKEAEAREAQQEANRTTVEAQREATEQATKAQAEANEAKVEARKEGAQEQVKATEEQRTANEKIAETQQAARERIAEAQGEANEKARDAVTSLAQAKTDYRNKAQKELDDVRKSLDELRTKTTTAQGNAKVALGTSLRTIDARRLELERDLAALDNAKTSDELNRRTAQLDKQIENLKEQVDAAQKNI